MPKLGIGMHYRCPKLTEEKFLGWVFDNVGTPNTVNPQILICGNHDLGVYFSFAPEMYKLRIGVYGEFTQQEGWERINRWAATLCQDCQVDLEAIEHDLYEDGKGKIGHWLIPLGPVVDKTPPATPPTETKPTRWN